jgi:type II secretory pathway pseudopilin PulG
MKLFTPSGSAIRCRDERGYMLITIILFVALLAIAMTAAAPLITRQVKRDREEEMIHRGVQYSRAIKHYVKKFGRYPTKIEDLENTSNIRFLRRRYKDPITGKDFKLLHMGEVQTSFGSNIAGATSVSNLAAAQASSGGFGSNTSFGNNSAFGGSTFGGNSGSTFGGGNAGSSFGGSTFGSGGFGNSPQSATNANQGNQAQNAGTDADSADQKVSGQSGQESSDANAKVFGGGPILGVASLSKEKSIRVFNKKDHYNQWQFIYDPTLDTGGLITTPFQPGMQSAGVMQQGVQGQAGTQNSPFGTQGSSFGQGSAFGQGSSFGSPGGMTPAPSQPQPQNFQSPFPPEQSPQQ